MFRKAAWVVQTIQECPLHQGLFIKPNFYLYLSPPLYICWLHHQPHTGDHFITYYVIKAKKYYFFLCFCFVFLISIQRNGFHYDIFIHCFCNFCFLSNNRCELFFYGIKPLAFLLHETKIGKGGGVDGRVEGAGDPSPVNIFENTYKSYVP